MWTGDWTGSRQDRVAGPCAHDVTPRVYKTQVILVTSWLNCCHVISDEQTSKRKDNTLYDSHKVYCYQSWTTLYSAEVIYCACTSVDTQQLFRQKSQMRGSQIARTCF